MRWMAVWTRAVIAPAARRAGAVWIGSGIVGAVIFGPTAMQPHDLTALALHVVPVGIALAMTWLLMYVPTARVLVRADAAAYLRALPGPRVAPVASAACALVALQLPWLALWWLGEGLTGVALVLAWTIAIVLVASVRMRPPRARELHWRGASTAFLGAYMRALRRHAADALVRAAGLAAIAGIAAAVLVHNNNLSGSPAATLATAAIVVVLVPGWAGALLPVLDAHRASAWLAASVGLSPLARVGVLAACVVGVYALAATIACVTAAGVLAAISHLSPATELRTVAALLAVGLGTATGAGLVVARLLVWAERATSATAPRVVISAMLASAGAVLALGLLGASAAVAMCAAGMLAVTTVKP